MDSYLYIVTTTAGAVCPSGIEIQAGAAGIPGQERQVFPTGGRLCLGGNH